MRAVWLPAAISAVLVFPGVALAHPHVFIDNRVTFLFEDGKVAGFRTDWRFDEIFTEDLIAQFDADGDKQFSAAESEMVRTETLPNLASFHYFTYAYVGGKDVGQLEPADFKADIVDGAVRFTTTYHLPQPADPRAETVAVSIYDHEYYVEVIMSEKEPVAVEGAGSDGCSGTITDDHAHAYFGGFVVPQLVTVTCP